jgi:Fe-S cluster assembly iron-binding protein IscA
LLIEAIKELSNKMDNLQQQINNGGSGNLQSVLDSGNSATDVNLILQSIAPITDQTIISQGFINLINSTSQMLLNQDEIQFTNTKRKAYNLFETGYLNNTLCYINNIETIINEYFNSV